MKNLYKILALFLIFATVISTISCTPEQSEESQRYSQGLDITLSSDGGSYFVSGIGECTDVEILVAREYDGKPIGAIGDYAFWGADSIKEVYIFENVESIGSDAFSYCTSLERMDLPSTLKSIGDYALCGCTALLNIYYNGTLSQWEAIEKGEGWCESAGFFVVYCSDGAITRDGVLVNK